ncbi:RNA polymerase sigma factor [Neolewinella persica]|uniref:RNA polymerase sigma factor n=1 Tax=Neolewinella persica TaxID=70998 RepID=UPI00037D808F|nr:RNA polymerase sigma factor [Neolewinella persica]
MSLFSNLYHSDKSDKELIQQARNGNKSALSNLIQRHQPFVYNIAWKMVGDPIRAEDLAQEALLKIVVNLASFKEESSFRTWAYRIVRNHFLNDKKKAKSIFAANFEDLGNMLDATESIDLTIEEQLVKADEVREVRLQCLSGMILCLNKEQRMIYIIGEILGADHIVGSEIMEISPANYRMKLSKARKDLYNFMQNKCGLVDKSNPCRCHKKVTVALERGMVDAKNLLFNKKEYSTFKSTLEADANYLVEESELVYAELHRDTSFKTHFKKKTLIEELLEGDDWGKRLNLN